MASIVATFAVVLIYAGFMLAEKGVREKNLPAVG